MGTAEPSGGSMEARAAAGFSSSAAAGVRSSTAAAARAATQVQADRSASISQVQALPCASQRHEAAAPSDRKREKRKMRGFHDCSRTGREPRGSALQGAASTCSLGWLLLSPSVAAA